MIGWPSVKAAAICWAVVVRILSVTSCNWATCHYCCTVNWLTFVVQYTDLQCFIRHKAFGCWYLQGSYVEAASQLRGCLQALGRPLPTTKFDLFASFFWNLLRQLLHRFYIGQWLEMRAGGIWRGISSHDIKVSARDAAVVYHKLLQLHLTGKH